MIQGTDTISSSRAVINTNFSNLNTDKAELSGATFTGKINGTSASLSLNFEAIGYASASQFFGGSLSTCNATTGKIIWSSGVFGCGTDYNTGGSGSSFTGLLMGEGSTTKTHIDSLTYSPSSFNFSPTASSGLLTIDYTNGPASRSLSQTWTGTPYFSVGASFSGTTKLKSSDITNALTFTPYNATNPSGYITGAQVPTNETDAAHDTCAEISGCVVGAITGNENITLTGGVTGSGTTSIVTIVASESYWDQAYSWGNHALAGYLTTIASESFWDTAYNQRIAVASASAWEGFRDAPSTRITAGTNLSWSDNTLNAVIGGVSSNSLNFDEFQNPLVADTDITFTGGPYSFTFDHASVSGNFEISGKASLSNTLYVTGGNVGIGTTEPLSKLDVAGTLRVGVLSSTGLIRGDNYNYGQGGAVYFSSSNTPASQFVQLGYNATGASDNFTPVMTVLSSGNVGIGNTSPMALLDVSGNIIASASGNVDISIQSTSATGASTQGLFVLRSAGASERLDILNNTTELVTIASTGNVGIGTTGPSQKLDVAGDINMNTGAAAYLRNGSNVLIGNNNSGTTYLSTGSTNLQVLNNTFGTSLVTIQNGGNVGIGTTSPTTKLDIIGNASVSGNFEVTGMTYSNLTGAVTGNASTATALAANGANCNAGEYPLGVDASGAVETCTDATTEINSIAGNYLLKTGGTLTGDLFGTNASLSGVFEMGTGARISNGTISQVTSLTSTANFFTTASVSSKLEVGTGDQFTVLAASGNTVIAGTLGVTGLANLGHASASGDFEIVGYASASQYFGAGMNTAGSCDDATDKLLYDSTSGLFTCGTLADADIPNVLTLSTITGPTSVSAAFEAATTSHLVGNVKIDGTVTFNGNVDGGASISFEIPNGATINANVAGEVFVDEGGFGQFGYYASGSVHTITDEKKVTISMASTSFNTFASRSLGYQFRGITIKRIWCKVSSATSVVINLSDGGDMDQLTCTTSNVFDDGTIANSGVAKGTELYLERRTVTGEADFLTITYTYVETRE